MEDLAKIAYEAYVKSCGGKSVKGEDLPAWEDVDREVQNHWDAVAQALAEVLT